MNHPVERRNPGHRRREYPNPRTARRDGRSLQRGAQNTESERPTPRDKRVFASLEQSPRAVIGEAFDEALRRDPERARRWVVLIDGNATQLDAVKAEAKRVGVKVTIIVDVVHVLEYVWKAARAIFGSTTPEAESWVSDRFLALLTGQSGGDVARTIRWWAGGRKPNSARRRAVEKACGYLTDRKRTRLMRYADALRDGLPISTGVIEGACRYLVKDRMDRTGARWSVGGAEAVLRLRAIRSSGDFDEYWQFHLARERHATMRATAPTASSPPRYPAAASISDASSDRKRTTPGRSERAVPFLVLSSAV